MLDWIITSAVLLVGFFVMVTGLIEYVLLAWLGILLIIVVLGVFRPYLGMFSNQKD